MTELYFHRRLRIMTFLAFLGMLVTTYLLYQHYKPSGGAFCNVNDYVSCDIVNKSRYAEIFGIPVAGLGFLAYTVMFIGSFGMIKQWFSTRFIPWMVIFSGVGVAFSLYLTFVELFLLRAVCMFCVVQQILILSLFFFSLILWLHQKKSFHFSS